MMQRPSLTPQQEGIREVRARYERGEISFDRFEYALNALLRAETPEQCRAIVQELPSSPIAALDMPVPPVAPPMSPRRWIVGIIGELKRIHRRWRLEQHTTVVMGIGEVMLDLRLATLPPDGLLEVYVLVGEATIYVPRNIHVAVQAFALVGETKALTEERSGIFVLLDEEELPAPAVPPAQGMAPELAQDAVAQAAPHLEIRVATVIGSVQVVPVGESSRTLRSGVDLSGINLRGVDLHGANLSASDLHGADLKRANLRGANLSASNLRGADLEQANLSGANLSASDLRAANLGGADLSGANLMGANLRGANLEGAVLHGTSGWPL